MVVASDNNTNKIQQEKEGGKMKDDDNNELLGEGKKEEEPVDLAIDVDDSDDEEEEEEEEGKKEEGKEEEKESAVVEKDSSLEAKNEKKDEDESENRNETTVATTTVATATATVATTTVATTKTTATAPKSKTPSSKKNQKKKVSHSKEIGNGLTALIPGYTAPMKLDTSDTSLATKHMSLSQLRKAAQKQDTKIAPYKTNFLPTTYASYSFKYGPKKLPDLSAGTGWFGMTPTEMTPDVKTDLKLIQNRNYLNPKKFYKRTDRFGSVVQIGTVIEGATEFYSSRLSKRERRNNLTEEIMADHEASGYAKRKYKQMQERDQLRQQERTKFKRRPKNKRARRGY